LRIGVVSDSHGDLYMLDKAIGMMGDIDLLVHLGDHYKDVVKVNSKYKHIIHSVPGNNDYIGNGESERLIEVCNKRVFITHGHKYNVNFGLMNLLYKGKEVGADIILYGHTHRYNLEYSEDIFFLNPGSVSRPRDRQASAAILNITDNGDIYADKLTLIY
jgi:putative phosphoesterase